MQQITGQSPTCPRCRREVVAGLFNCSHCGASLADAKRPLRWGRIAFGPVLFFGLLAACGVAMASGSSDSLGSQGSDGPDKYGAFDVCTQAIEDRLKAPSTAKFRNPYQDDGEVRISGRGDRFYVYSSVDAQNSFGAQIRSDWSCTATHISGDSWRTTDVEIY